MENFMQSLCKIRFLGKYYCPLWFCSLRWNWWRFNHTGTGRVWSKWCPVSFDSHVAQNCEGRYASRLWGYDQEFAWSIGWRSAHGISLCQYLGWNQANARKSSVRRKNVHPIWVRNYAVLIENTFLSTVNTITWNSPNCRRPDKRMFRRANSGVVFEFISMEYPQEYATPVIFILSSDASFSGQHREHHPIYREHIYYSCI